MNAVKRMVIMLSDSVNFNDAANKAHCTLCTSVNTAFTAKERGIISVSCSLSSFILNTDNLEISNNVALDLMVLF